MKYHEKRAIVAMVPALIIIMILFALPQTPYKILYMAIGGAVGGALGGLLSWAIYGKPSQKA